tara:strand:+ start:298 stop:1020 length:723 start_codon:yes stop_codon:yes gene_type:complete
MSKIIIHIGARKNSKGLKNKNIRELLGKPLIQHTIEHAKKIKKVHKIVVSSDSKKILDISKKLKVDIQILRPDNLSSSNSSKFSVWKHSLKFLMKKKLMSKNDLFLDLDCTCPVRDISDIKQMVKKFLKLKKNNKLFDGLFSITPARKNPYFNLVEYNRDNFLTLSKNAKNTIFTRQKCPRVYEHVASIYCLKPSFILNKKSFMKGKLLGHEIKQFTGWDIDNKFDFEMVKYILKINNKK